MKLTFSQGINKHSTDTGLPSGSQNFLVLQPGNAQVDLHAPLDQPFQAALSHRDTHYLLTITNSSDIQSWGYGAAVDYNAAFAIGNGSGDNSDEFYLWVNIDPVTGETSYGYSKEDPISGTESSTGVAKNRKDDLHWFDTTTNVMKVWRKFATAVSPYGRWVDVIRVFTGKYTFGSSTFESKSVNAPSFLGTQVGLVGSFHVGSLIYDSLGNPLVRTDADNHTVFFTTEDVFLTGLPTGARARYETFLVDAIGQTPASAFTMVRFSDFNEVIPLTAATQANNLWGIIEFDIGASGDLTQVVLSGVVRNANWVWTDVGQQIFVDKDQPGQLAVTESGPTTTGITRNYAPFPNQLPIGVAIDEDALLLRRPELTLSTGGVVAISHTSLSDLDSDDHSQYFNEARGDTRYLRLNAGNDPITDNLRINGNVGINKNPDTNDYTLEVIGTGSPQQAAEFTGDIKVNSQILGSGASQGVGAPTFAFHDDSDTGVYWPAANQIGLAAGGNPTLVVTSAGVVTVNNAYSLPAADGAAGQVLKTDGAGDLTFQDDVLLGSPHPLFAGDNVSELVNDAGYLTSVVLDDLGDVTTGSPTPGSGDVLTFNGSIWTAETPVAPVVGGGGTAVTGGVDIAVGAPSGSPLTQAIDIDYPLDEAPDGSRSAPTYSFSSETNTGWYKPDVNTIELAVDGEESITVINRGGSPIQPTVGSPDELASVGLDLHVNNDGTGDTQVRIEASAASTDALIHLITANGTWKVVNDSDDDDLKFLWNNTVRFTMQDNDADFILHGTGSAAPALQLADDTDTFRYAIRAPSGMTGNQTMILPDQTPVAGAMLVGAGGSPEGGVTYTNEIDHLFLSDQGGNTFRWRLIENGSNELEIGYEPGLTSLLTLAASGTLTSTGQNLGADGAEGTPTYAFSSDGGVGMYRSGSDTLAFATGSTKKLELLPTGVLRSSVLMYETYLSDDNDIPNKAYVDSLSAGLDPKESVRVATIGSGSPLAGGDLGGSYAVVGSPEVDGLAGVPRTIDGVLLNVGNRVLVKDQSDAKQNGIYVVISVSASPATADLKRAPDQDGTPAAEVSGGNFTYVEQGSQAGSNWVVVHNGVIALNVDSINWTPVAGVGGGAANLLIGGLLDVTDALGSGGKTPSTAYAFRGTGPGDLEIIDLETLADSLYLRLDTTNDPLTGTLTINGSGSPQLAIVANGDVEVNSQIRTEDGSELYPAYSFQNDPGSGLYRESGALVFSIDGEEAFRVIRPVGSPLGPDVGSPRLFDPSEIGIFFHLKNNGEGDSILRLETDVASKDAHIELVTSVSTWSITNEASISDELVFAYDDIPILILEPSGLLRVPSASPAYESLVADDNDIPNKAYVDGVGAVAAASSVPLVVPPIMGLVVPTPKAALGPIGPAAAVHPPGSFAFVIDDLTGPSAFIFTYVDGTSTWVRSDTLLPIS